MTENTQQQQSSQLIAVLREGIGVVQMIIFKRLRDYFADKYADRNASTRSMLVGAIINRLFGQENSDEKFKKFNRENKTDIKQEMLTMATQFPELKGIITDALRVQVLCDNQEGRSSTVVLERAHELGLLIQDRDIPLPSTFMLSIRKLGEDNGLTVAPVTISKEDDTLIS